MFFTWSSDVYATFVISKFFYLSHGSASKKFIFTDCSVLIDSAFSFAFSLLLFSVWFSLLHKIAVAVVDVPKCGCVYVMSEHENFLLCTNPLMRTTMSFGVKEVFKNQERGWYDEIKNSEKPKLGDVPLVHPSISQEDSSI